MPSDSDNNVRTLPLDNSAFLRMLSDIARSLLESNKRPTPDPEQILFDTIVMSNACGDLAKAIAGAEAAVLARRALFPRPELRP